MIEWYFNSSVLQLFFTIFIFIIVNLSRTLFCHGLTMMFWDYLTTPECEYLGNMTVNSSDKTLLLLSDNAMKTTAERTINKASITKFSKSNQYANNNNNDKSSRVFQHPKTTADESTNNNMHTTKKEEVFTIYHRVTSYIHNLYAFGDQNKRRKTTAVVITTEAPTLAIHHNLYNKFVSFINIYPRGFHTHTVNNYNNSNNNNTSISSDLDSPPSSSCSTDSTNNPLYMTSTIPPPLADEENTYDCDPYVYPYCTEDHNSLFQSQNHKVPFIFTTTKDSDSQKQRKRGKKGIYHHNYDDYYSNNHRCDIDDDYDVFTMNNNPMSTNHLRLSLSNQKQAHKKQIQQSPKKSNSKLEVVKNTCRIIRTFFKNKFKSNRNSEKSIAKTKDSKKKSDDDRGNHEKLLHTISSHLTLYKWKGFLFAVMSILMNLPWIILILSVQGDIKYVQKSVV